jgi:hypothetical protein
MYKTTQLQKMPNTLELYSRIAMSAMKKPKPFLPNLEVKIENLRVTEKEISAYNKLCGFGISTTVPSTYLFVKTFSLKTYLMSSLEMPFPVLGSIHFANKIKQIEPLLYNEPFSVTCRTGNLIAHKKGQAFEINTSVEAGGRVIWEETMVSLCKGKEGLGEVLDWDIEDIGDNFEKKIWNFEENLGLKYAQASGDFNPIHLIPITAKLFGFKRHIMHGMYTAGKVLAQFPKVLNQPHEFAVSFKTPIFLPSTVVFRNTEKDKNITLDVVDKKEEQPHLKGFIKY